MIFIYRIFINLVFFLSPIIILIRLLRRKEHPRRFKEKIGFFKKNNPKGKLIWFHGASVGELQSIVPLIEKLEKIREIKKILVTSNTLSSSEVISKFKFKKVIHQFFPLDNKFIVKKFIDHWQPSIALFIDSEIWPNMLFNLDNNKIPAVLLNARITKKSFNKWIKIKFFSKIIFSKFKLCLCSNKETVEFLKKLGAKNIKYYGNLKYSQLENENIKIDSETVKFIKKRNTWCASSTHYPEEKFIGHVHKELKKNYKDLLTVIIPRHINREKNIKDQLINLGLKVHSHKPKIEIKKKIDIYLVNTFGQTKSFYSIIKTIFLGGSLINHGGQNPLEAANYNCNILHGPHTSNFSEIYKYLDKQKISKKINNVNQAVKYLKKQMSKKIKKNNARIKINKIGQKILKKNINEIILVLKKL
jgi:3-deoxy-D-manno-octulosonic-acid transferase